MNIDLTKLVTNMEEEIIINDSFELDKELFSKTSIRDLKDVKFEGTITKIPNDEGLKIPHIGWNSLDIKKKDGIFKGIDGNPYVYFVHSYYLKAADKDIVAAQTNYGVTIDAAVAKGNVFATQFHPEKSGETGLKILKNFADIVKG